MLQVFIFLFFFIILLVDNTLEFSYIIIFCDTILYYLFLYVK